MNDETIRALVALFAITLAACGGNGGGTCVADCGDPDGGGDAGVDVGGGVSCELQKFCDPAIGSVAVHGANARWGQRIPIGRRPFLIERLGYSLADGTDTLYDIDCRPQAAHAVEFYEAELGEDVPSGDATAVFEVAEDGSGTGPRDVTLEIDPPYLVEADRELFITFPAIARGNELAYSCVDACPDLEGSRIEVRSTVAGPVGWVVVEDFFPGEIATRFDLRIQGRCLDGD